jgi:hypothetical protein
MSTFDQLNTKAHRFGLAPTTVHSGHRYLLYRVETGEAAGIATTLEGIEARLRALAAVAK